MNLKMDFVLLFTFGTRSFLHVLLIGCHSAMFDFIEAEALVRMNRQAVVHVVT